MLLDHLFHGVLQWSWSGRRRPVGDPGAAYRLAWRRAESSGDWSEQTLRDALKDGSVRGAYGEPDREPLLLLHTLWRDRTPPAETGRRLRAEAQRRSGVCPCRLRLWPGHRTQHRPDCPRRPL